jgi:hypothetical protein
MDNLVYLKNVLKKRKYSISKINKIKNELDNKKIYYQIGGDGENINWDPLIKGYSKIIEKFKILNDPEFKDLVETMINFVDVFEKK